MARLVIAVLVVAVATAFVAVDGRLVRPIVDPAAGNSARPLADGVDQCAWTCDHVRYKKMCHALRAKIPGAAAGSPRQLLRVALTVSLSKAAAAKAKFEEAKRASHLGNPMASILDTCSKSYGDLVDELEQAQRCVDANDTRANIISKMTAASTFAGDCDDSFEEMGVESIYDGMQRHVARVVSSTLAIAAKIT
ncbi:hypothetical protein GUJ93_ZPchr0010g9356 [Zizania palustris]|uniref:Pectinesterase inhibitor domain-containing protein n=1 Tax=Zizania palustris TaxID=103762 RepID=A0A8J6BJ90_ZIZPA|nr:hypothetical protein GUJ93_ZPchr0010g9356 [Zizania palustris]